MDRNGEGDALHEKDAGVGEYDGTTPQVP